MVGGAGAIDMDTVSMIGIDGEKSMGSCAETAMIVIGLIQDYTVKITS